jgi:hypothetical protein
MAETRQDVDKSEDHTNLSNLSNNRFTLREKFLADLFNIQQSHFQLGVHKNIAPQSEFRNILNDQYAPPSLNQITNLWKEEEFLCINTGL